jgi:hypothetical protein
MLSSTELLDCLQIENSGATGYLQLLPVELQNNLRARNSTAVSVAVSQRSRGKRDDSLVTKIKVALGEENYLQLGRITT